MEEQSAAVILEEVSSVKLDIGHLSVPRSILECNQDRVVVNQNGDFLWTFVFDGHGGDQVSDALAKIAESKDPVVNRFLKLDLLVNASVKDAEVKMLAKSVFAEIDQLFAKRYSIGSTIVMGIHHIPTGRVRFLHLGDSRAIWRIKRSRLAAIHCSSQTTNQNGEPVNKDFGSELMVVYDNVDGATADHKANRPDEKARVVSLGGNVIHIGGTHRVNGNLAISRAFGDFNEKPYISAEPEISPLLEMKADDFYILGSDGVWDVRKSHTVRDDLTGSRKITAQEFASTLVKFCSERSGDDTSAIVVKICPNP